MESKSAEVSDGDYAIVAGGDSHSESAAEDRGDVEVGLRAGQPDSAAADSAAQLVCLSYLENLNALFISEGMERKERLVKLNQTAIRQMELLTDDAGVSHQGN